MSEIESTITRIQGHDGVNGLWIVGSKGETLRKFYKKSDQNQKDIEGQRIVDLVMPIVEKAQILVRDLDPSNALIFMRVRSKNDEIMVAPDKDLTIVALQDLSAGHKKEQINH